MLIGREHPGETQLDDLGRRDLLHAGRAACRYGFATLNVGLQPVRDGEGRGHNGTLACFGMPRDAMLAMTKVAIASTVCVPACDFSQVSFPDRLAS